MQFLTSKFNWVMRKRAMLKCFFGLLACVAFAVSPVKAAEKSGTLFKSDNATERYPIPSGDISDCGEGDETRNKHHEPNCTGSV